METISVLFVEEYVALSGVYEYCGDINYTVDTTVYAGGRRGHTDALLFRSDGAYLRLHSPSLKEAPTAPTYSFGGRIIIPTMGCHPVMDYTDACYIYTILLIVY